MVIKRIKGDTVDLDIQLFDVEDNEINLTGCTVFFTVKRNLQDADSKALISKDITSFTSPTTGDVAITLTAVDVDYVGEFFYDIKIKYTNGKIQSVLTDKFILAAHTTIRTS